MCAVIPDSKLIKYALKWISENQKKETTGDIELLIVQASNRFNLSPVEVSFLKNFYLDHQSTVH
jgi:hypothetical protein